MPRLLTFIKANSSFLISSYMSGVSLPPNFLLNSFLVNLMMLVVGAQTWIALLSVVLCV